MKVSRLIDKAIIIDTAQQAGKHERKHRDFHERGYETILAPLPVGDYILVNDKVKDVLRRKYERKTAIKKIDLLGSYNVAVDTKKDMQEIYGDIVGKQHDRFRDECILAQNNNIRLVILVENSDNIKTLQDVAKWKNERYTRWHRLNGLHKVGKYQSVKIPNKPPANSVALMKAMITMQLKYGVEFRFCTPMEAGSQVLAILEGGDSG